MKRIILVIVILAALSALLIPGATTIVSANRITALHVIQIRHATALNNLPENQPQNQSQKLNGLQEYVEDLMKKLGVTPGLAIAVVLGDRVIFSQGFGYRNVKSKLPVTPKTMFYIASTTKSFTAAAAKILADEGKLDLDVPIRNYFPKLTLKAPLSAEQISLRDLLTHRSGLSTPAVNFRTAYTGQYDTDEIFNLLSTATTPIPPTFNYDNLGYIITGYAIDKATGESWQKQVSQKLLEPLGMVDTTFYASKAMASTNVALPYISENGAFVELPYKQDNTMHAAGGMSSSVEDLAKWLIVHMNGGKYQGKQIIPLVSLEEILSPQVNQKQKFYKFDRYAYGIGWNIATYNGDKLVHCFGTYDGFRPHVSFMPADNLGVIVLTNESRDGIFLPDLIASDIYDYLLRKQAFSVSSNSRIDEYAARIQKNTQQRAEALATRERAQEKGTKPTLNLEAYAGVYESPEWGRIVITVESGAPVVRFGNLSALAQHYQRDVFDVTFIPGRTSQFTFTVNPKEGVTSLSTVLTGLEMSFAKVKKQ